MSIMLPLGARDSMLAEALRPPLLQNERGRSLYATLIREGDGVRTARRSVVLWANLKPRPFGVEWAVGSFGIGLEKRRF
jgi:hypothetical protein